VASGWRDRPYDVELSGIRSQWSALSAVSAKRLDETSSAHSTSGAPSATGRAPAGASGKSSERKSACRSPRADGKSAVFVGPSETASSAGVPARKEHPVGFRLATATVPVRTRSSRRAVSRTTTDIWSSLNAVVANVSRTRRPLLAAARTATGAPFTVTPNPSVGGVPLTVLSAVSSRRLPPDAVAETILAVSVPHRRRISASQRLLPGPPSTRSWPGPPQMRSLPPPAMMMSGPPRPTMTSLRGVPRSTSENFVPTFVATAPKQLGLVAASGCATPSPAAARTETRPAAMRPRFAKRANGARLPGALR
jgi:hypothetical protein